MTYFPAWYSSIIGTEGLTAVFGMGTGVAPLLWSPGHKLDWPIRSGPGRLRRGSRAPVSRRKASVFHKLRSARREPDRRWIAEARVTLLVCWEWAEDRNCHGQADWRISTGWLDVTVLHRRPIDQVVFLVPSGSPLRGPRDTSRLGEGFPLRCFQRLSLPDVATQRCP